MALCVRNSQSAVIATAVVTCYSVSSIFLSLELHLKVPELNTFALTLDLSLFHLLVNQCNDEDWISYYGTSKCQCVLLYLTEMSQLS